MKLFYLVLGLAVLGLAGTSFYYSNIKKKDSLITVAATTPQESSIYIYKEYGDVSFKNKASNTFTQVNNEKMRIANYSTVKTGDGRGYVILPDNSSITLASSTEIEINYEPTKVSILQLLGSTYHRVTALATGNKYEVRTPNTLAAIRGTKLAVTYNPKTKKTLVAVTEHRVEVTQTKEDGSPSKAPVIVQEGSLADVQSSTSTIKNSTSTRSDGSMVIRTITDVKEIKLFIEENKVIDKEYDKTHLPERKIFLEKIIDSLQKDTIDSAPGSTRETPETRTETITRVVTGIKTDAQIPKTNQPTGPTTGIVDTPVKTPSITPVREIPAPNVTAPTITKTLRSLPVLAEELTPEDEAFVNNFYPVYERYFFVDDPVTYCTKIGAMTTKDMVGTLLLITNKAGITLPRQAELSTFASELTTSCADGSMKSKISDFKTRFDSAYPY